jgi:hypothetical protein
MSRRQTSWQLQSLQNGGLILTCAPHVPLSLCASTAWPVAMRSLRIATMGTISRGKPSAPSDHNSVKLLGCWKSDATVRFLHLETQSHWHHSPLQCLVPSVSTLSPVFSLIPCLAACFPFLIVLGQCGLQAAASHLVVYPIPVSKTSAESSATVKLASSEH